MTLPVCRPEEITADRVKAFCDEHPGLELNDNYDAQIDELIRLSRPDLPPDSPEFTTEAAAFRKSYTNPGHWFYYPWRSSLVHVMAVDDYRLVRSSRNQNLLTKDEQRQLGRMSVGVAGLSVGASVLRALALTGYYKRLVIADHDTLELSNLNRLPGSITETGLPKVVMAARSVYELDPYAEVEIYQEGLSTDNVGTFVKGLNVVVCAMDGLDMKVRLRLAAREARVPVVMATDVENLLLDVEPFHLEPDRPIFHGNVTEEETARMLEGNLTKPEFINLAMRIIGLEDLTERLLESLPQIGRTLVSQPQLGSSAMMAGGLAAQVIHRILLGQPVPSGRLAFGVATQIDPDYHGSDAVARRRRITDHMIGGS